MLAMGGWGTFCHGKTRDLPRSVLDRFEVLIFDYRGLGESSEAAHLPATMRSYADDCLALLDHLGWEDVHLLGMVGMGACVAQEIAYLRPGLARSLVMTGCWAYCDPRLADQLLTFRDVHLGLGFTAFQRLCASFSFSQDFYAQNVDRILGQEGAWSDLLGREAAHARLVDACIAHDIRDRLPEIRVPSLVLHAGEDPITTARHTGEIEALMPSCRGVTWDDVAHVIAGKEQKIRFSQLLDEFYDELGA